MKKEKRISSYDTTGEIGFKEMLGAIFFMALGGFKKKYEHYYQIKYQRKNIIVGYFLSLIIVFGAIALTFYFLSIFD